MGNNQPKENKGNSEDQKNTPSALEEQFNQRRIHNNSVIRNFLGDQLTDITVRIGRQTEDHVMDEKVKTRKDEIVDFLKFYRNNKYELIPSSVEISPSLFTPFKNLSDQLTTVSGDEYQKYGIVNFYGLPFHHCVLMVVCNFYATASEWEKFADGSLSEQSDAEDCIGEVRDLIYTGSVPLEFKNQVALYKACLFLGMDDIVIKYLLQKIARQGTQQVVEFFMEEKIDMPYFVPKDGTFLLWPIEVQNYIADSCGGIKQSYYPTVVDEDMSKMNPLLVYKILRSVADDKRHYLLMENWRFNGHEPSLFEACAEKRHSDLSMEDIKLFEGIDLTKYKLTPRKKLKKIKNTKN